MIHPPSFRRTRSPSPATRSARAMPCCCAASSSASARRTRLASGPVFGEHHDRAREHRHPALEVDGAASDDFAVARFRKGSRSTSRSTPTTSACAAGGVACGCRLPSIERSSLPASGVGTISVWKPSAGTSAREIGNPLFRRGLLVSMRIRSASSWGRIHTGLCWCVGR